MSRRGVDSSRPGSSNCCVNTKPSPRFAPVTNATESWIFTAEFPRASDCWIAPRLRRRFWVDWKVIIQSRFPLCPNRSAAEHRSNEREGKSIEPWSRRYLCIGSTGRATPLPLFRSLSESAHSSCDASIAKAFAAGGMVRRKQAEFAPGARSANRARDRLKARQVDTKV